MSKLYLIAALAIAESYQYLAYTVASPITTISAVSGKFTYTVSATDCFSAATATTLGLNNIYYQYYTFTVAKGAITHTTVAQSTVNVNTVNHAYNACAHTHLANWMAQP